MIDPTRWFGGADHDDEDDDPVTKTLRYLGLESAGNAVAQGASDVGAGIGQAVQDVGSSVGAAVSPYLPQPSATPAPEDYSFAPPDNPLAAGLAAAGKAGVEAYEETGGPLSPWSGPAFAPARAAYIAERALPEIGGEIGAAAGRAAAGPDAAPYFTVPESVPVFGGQDVGAEQVGRFIGSGVTDPLTYVGAAGAAAAGAPARRVAAELARGLPGVGEAELLGRGAVGAVRGLGSRVGEAFAGNAERVAAADARMAAEGSTLAPGTFGALPGGSNLEARIAAAEARLEHAASRLEAADAMLAQAADAGSAAELRAARSGYSPARSAYDEAAARVEQLREQRRMVSRDIEGAGYGRPVEDAGIDTSAVEREATSAYRGQPEAVPPFRDDAPRSISPNAGFGVVPDAAGPDRLGAVNRVLGQGIASSVSGGVGAQVNQEMNPDDPLAGIKGFAAGALVPPLAARGGMALARRAGRSADLGSAARIGLGDVPPSRIRRPALPGVEPPYVREHIPDVSETPNRPPVLGDVPPSRIRQPELPGFDREAVAPLRTAAEAVLGPAAEGAAQPSVGGRLPGMAPSAVERVRGALAPWLDRAGILRYAGMLSDTAGHAQNAVGNLITVGAAPLETGIAAGLDTARAGAARAIGGPIGRGLGGPERTVWLGEVPAMLGGMSKGAKAGLDDAVSIMRTGVSPEEAGKLDSGRARFGTNIPRIAPAGSRRAAVADFAVEGPLRSLAAADAIFRGSSHAGHLAAETLAEATRRAGGATPTPEQLRLALHDPGVVTRAEDQARRAVLQEERGITTAYRRFIEAAPAEARLALQTVVPFVRTPYNVMAQGLGMTDVGALVGVVSDLARGKGPRAVQKRLGRAALGTAVMGWATSDYAEGNLTGPYPSDGGEASTLPPGWRPWSRKVDLPNGETWYVPLAALGPFAVPAVYAILRAEAIKKGADAFSPEWAGDVAMGLGRYAEQSTFLEGLGQVSKLFDERSGDANLGKLINQTVASYSPHVVGGGALGREIQRIVGMPAREPGTPLEALEATHPLTAGLVPPRQDVLGREQSMGIGGPAGLVVRGGVEDDAAVIAAFRDAQQSLPRSAPKSLTDPGTKQSVSLTAEQRRTWDEAFGAAIQQRWASAGAPSDAKRLEEVASKAREDARRAVLGR